VANAELLGAEQGPPRSRPGRFFHRPFHLDHDAVPESLASRVLRVSARPSSQGMPACFLPR